MGGVGTGGVGMGGVGTRVWYSGVRDEGSQAGVDDHEAISERLGMGVGHTMGSAGAVGASDDGWRRRRRWVLGWKRGFPG